MFLDLGREESFGADEGLSGVNARDQPDIGQLGHPARKDDVRGFDIAVDESMTVEVLEGGDQRQGDIQTLREGQPGRGSGADVSTVFGKVKIGIQDL